MLKDPSKITLVTSQGDITLTYSEARTLFLELPKILKCCWESTEFYSDVEKLTQDFEVGVNTILHTKDGRQIGNAIVTAKEGEYYAVKTDYGNNVVLTRAEINEMFYVAWCHLQGEYATAGLSCEAMQRIASEDHKHRVDTKALKQCSTLHKRLEICRIV